MISDFKYALRTLAKTPGFTIIAVITLALAIGANTAIFSLINDLFLRSLSFKEPRRVVHFLSNAPDRKLVDLPLSLPRFQHYRAGQTMCEDLGAENVFAFTLTGLGDAVQLFGGRVTSNYFDVLGLRPIRGRNFCLTRRKAPMWRWSPKISGKNEWVGTQTSLAVASRLTVWHTRLLACCRTCRLPGSVRTRRSGQPSRM